MTASAVVVRFTWLIAVLSCVAAGVGALSTGGTGPIAFTTLQGHVVQLYGRGLYRHDSLLIANGYRGTDVATLVVAVPLLALALFAYRRGSLRGGFVLAGVLGYFLYYYASLALGAAYNPLFVLYVVLFAASLYAFGFTLASFDVRALRAQFADDLPVRPIAWFLFVVGGVLVAAWLPPVVKSLIRGEVPLIVESYTTVITWALDLAVVVPAVVIAGVLLLRRRPFGYLLTGTLLVLCLTIGVSLVAQGIAQFVGGVPLTTGEVVAFMLPFALLTIGGVWPTVAFFRRCR